MNKKTGTCISLFSSGDIYRDPLYLLLSHQKERNIGTINNYYKFYTTNSMSPFLIKKTGTYISLFSGGDIYRDPQYLLLSHQKERNGGTNIFVFINNI